MTSLSSIIITTKKIVHCLIHIQALEKEKKEVGRKEEEREERKMGWKERMEKQKEAGREAQGLVFTSPMSDIV